MNFRDAVRSPAIVVDKDRQRGEHTGVRGPHVRNVKYAEAERNRGQTAIVTCWSEIAFEGYCISFAAA